MTEEEQPNKLDSQTASASDPSQPAQATKDVTQEKSVIPQLPPPDKKHIDESIALAIVEKTEEGDEEKPSEGSSINRDAVLARVATQKRMSLIKAWEESEKSRAENKTQKKLSSISSWENSKIAATEAELKKIHQQLEKKKAEYAEKLRNKIAAIHREAEEKKAFIEAKKEEYILKAEETAAKYRATGTAPKKIFGCF
ncbi:hypothetical protein PIB30_006003 [Stylosanthes scabra]|uniref:Remorin n=1 Tax=Stylosanthes scabra TaxID=79078 RepID=A0ABU6T4I6_9FABA|nr:hypothetical protein [Stylosanthes scabra]